MHRKIALPAVVLGLGLSAVALSPTLATAAPAPAEHAAVASAAARETHQAVGDRAFSLAVDSVDVTAGTAHVSGTADKSDDGNVTVNGILVTAWTIEDGPVGTRWEATVRGLVPGANSISAKLVEVPDPTYPARTWKTVATIPTFDLQVGTGTGFTATATHDTEAGTVTVSGTYTPGMLLAAGSARSGIEWDEYIRVRGDGTYSMTVPERTWGREDVFVSNDNDFRTGITRVVPVAEVIERAATAS